MTVVSWASDHKFIVKQNTTNKVIDRNKIKEVCSIFRDPREQMSNNVTDRSINKNIAKCPEIYIKIEGIETRALIDTGSEITCISQKFFDNHKDI